MKLSLFQVDAFASEVFRGNPAAVVPLEQWLADEAMQAIAMENQLSETAFFVAEKESIGLRWFTPTIEVDLCGHATLATAHVLFRELGTTAKSVTFQTRSGALAVDREERGYSLDLPADVPSPNDEHLPSVREALGTAPLQLLRGKDDLVAVFPDEGSLLQLAPDFRRLARIPVRGLITTGPGREVDFVSRCFFPAAGIDEDPVTGSAHATITPLWSGRLGRETLTARQLSTRGGEIGCRCNGDRVTLTGDAVTYLRGTIEIPSEWETPASSS